LTHIKRAHNVCAIFSIDWNGRQIEQTKHHFELCFGTKLRLEANRLQVRQKLAITKKCRQSLKKDSAAFEDNNEPEMPLSFNDVIFSTCRNLFTALEGALSRKAVTCVFINNAAFGLIKDSNGIKLSITNGVS
ncbi:hypothetical protein T10_6263, partial [Trichinella papuae]